eukprot:767627-Hanusia_phi.AAC.1
MFQPVLPPFEQLLKMLDDFFPMPQGHDSQLPFQCILVEVEQPHPRHLPHSLIPPPPDHIHLPAPPRSSWHTARMQGCSSAAISRPAIPTEEGEAAEQQRRGGRGVVTAEEEEAGEVIGRGGGKVEVWRSRDWEREGGGGHLGRGPALDILGDDEASSKVLDGELAQVQQAVDSWTLAPPCPIPPHLKPLHHPVPHARGQGLVLVTPERVLQDLEMVVCGADAVVLERHEGVEDSAQDVVKS